MHLAVQKSTHILMMDYLLGKGCNVNVKDNDGKTPIDYCDFNVPEYDCISRHIQIVCYSHVMKKLIIADADLKEGAIDVIVGNKDRILDNCQPHEKVMVLTYLTHALDAIGHSDTSKMMRELEKVQNDTISYLHEKIIDRREQIKLCEEIEQSKAKAKVISYIKPQIDGFYKKITDVKSKLKENDDDILGTLIESISLGSESEYKLGNKIREFLPALEESLYVACLLTKGAFLSAEEKYKLRLATGPIKPLKN